MQLTIFFFYFKMLNIIVLNDVFVTHGKMLCVKHGFSFFMTHDLYDWCTVYILMYFHVISCRSIRKSIAAFGWKTTEKEENINKKEHIKPSFSWSASILSVQGDAFTPNYWADGKHFCLRLPIYLLRWKTMIYIRTILLEKILSDSKLVNIIFHECNFMIRKSVLKTFYV